MGIVDFVNSNIKNLRESKVRLPIFNFITIKGISKTCEVRSNGHQLRNQRLKCSFYSSLYIPRRLQCWRLGKLERLR